MNQYFKLIADIIASLAPGERFAGTILHPDGMPSHHVILLDGEAASVIFAGAQEFAAGLGGDLPTRREQSLLFTNQKEQFQRDWYWSSEQHAGYSDYAWLQDFDDGYQGYDKSSKCRARAVRRVYIQEEVK